MRRIAKIFFAESVSRRGNNPGAKRLEKQAFSERDCYWTVTRTLQLSERAFLPRKTRRHGAGISLGKVFCIKREK